MIHTLLLVSMLASFTVQAKGKDSNERKWIVSPRVSFGAMETINIDIPRYKQDTPEYRILQLALDVENVFPYDVQYEGTYLSNIPKDLHAIVSKRNATYMKVGAAKKAGRAMENEDTGLLDISESATPDEKEIITAENEARKELYTKAGKQLRLSSSDREKVSKIYAQAIKYQKYYALSDEPVFTEQKDSHIITSMASSYKFKTVWDVMMKVMEEEGLALEKTETMEKTGTMSVVYKCGSDNRNFVVRLCTIKDKKLSSCRKGPKNESLYSYVDNGTLIWVEAGKDSKKSLVIADDTSEFEEILYCKDEPRKFDLLEKLSSKLISADPTNPAPTAAVETVKKEEVKKEEPKKSPSKDTKKKDKKKKNAKKK